MEQLSIFSYSNALINNKVESFSADTIGREDERKRLEEKYSNITFLHPNINRQSVSFQLSKNDSLHRWLKYREGFSSELVRLLLKEFDIKKGDTVLDPFVGSGTTSLVCSFLGIDSIGFDILPMSRISIEAKKRVYEYDTSEINQLITDITNLVIPNDYNKKVSYINITNGAYPDLTEKEIAFLSEWINNSQYSEALKNLARLCILNSLESVSYTVKDGQFLRWDLRSKKMLESLQRRIVKNKKTLAIKLDKGLLPSLQFNIIKELTLVLNDIVHIQSSVINRLTCDVADINFIEGNALYELPKLKSNTINAVITSPPYCNRYDYTRTYALELAFLGINDIKLKELRQELLSCTVENKSKLSIIKQKYIELDREEDYNIIVGVVNNNKAFLEIIDSLKYRVKAGEMNNSSVVRMVENYFIELTFIFAEIFRICKSGSRIAFVNDNVRYAGEVIPVDYLSCELAEQLGFIPLKIYSLKQQKGNSSQQMAKYGRVPLRKSITIWEKP